MVWGKVKINPIIDWLNPVIKHGLDSKIKYVRILWQQYRQLASEVGESETLRSDSSAEQVSIKLGNISQINQEGLKANACLLA